MEDQAAEVGQKVRKRPMVAQKACTYHQAEADGIVRKGHGHVDSISLQTNGSADEERSEIEGLGLDVYE